MELEDTKLNHKLIFSVNAWTEQHLKDIAQHLGMSKGTLARAMINRQIHDVLCAGIENLSIFFYQVESKDRGKKK